MLSTCRFVVVLILASALAPGISAAQLIGGDVGYYQVDSVPSGADVHFDGEYKGTTPVTIQVYSTGTPGHSLSVSLSGYKTWTKDLPGNPGAGEVVPVMAVLEPVVRYGSLSVTSDPSGAAISLNGNYRGNTPISIPNLLPGTYTIRADYPGYEPQSILDSVIAGQDTAERFTLKRIVRTGAITILSTPSGAFIYLDGEYEGRTPLTIQDIQPGIHIIELDAGGYYDWKTTVSVIDGSSQAITATLSPIPSAATGWIEVSSKPAGAALFLDGVPKGQTPAQGARTIDAVQPGDHTVKLQLAGYQDYVTTVTVRASTTSSVSASLTAAPIATVTPVTGTLSVASAPSGANVFVDNLIKGLTPCTLSGITPGTRNVKISLAGYKDWTMDVQVPAGSIIPVNAVMDPAATPQPTRTPLLPLGAVAALALLIAIRRR